MAESHTVNDGSSSARKRRGRSSLKDLIQRHKDAGTKEPITLKGDGTIEGSVSTSFRSYLGIVVRLRCPISHRTWKSVPAEHKDMVWEDVTELFDVPQNDLTRKFKKQEMRGAGTMWRNFKSDLANKYIFERKHGGDPTIMYPFITPDQWTSFVEQRMTNEAQELRARNIDKAKSNQYQHTLSRGGYKKAREELIAEKKAQMEEQGLISAEEEPLVQIERHEVWKRGHQRRNREYVNDSMRMVAEKIDELQELASQGQVTPRGRRDILTEATGKDEYPGRTRGVGSLVGWTTVFGKKSSSCSTCSAVTSHAPTLQSHHSGSDPCPFTDITESGKKCILHVHGDSESGTEIVTLGKVMPGRVVQYQELDDDKVKVIIDEAIKPSAELPQRFGYMETVSDAVHAFVGWPKCLVDVDEKTRFFKLQCSSFEDDLMSRMTMPCRFLYEHARGMGKSTNYSVYISSEVFGEDCYVDLNNDCITEFTTFQAVSAAAVEVHLRFLHDKLRPGIRFGFVRPSYVTPSVDFDTRVEFFQRRVKMPDYEHKLCYFVPYIDIKEYHWMLIVIFPKSRLVLWLDHIAKAPRDDAVKFVNTSMCLSLNIPSASDITWKTVTCPSQPLPSDLCGFYVVQYIHEIIKFAQDTNGALEYDIEQCFPRGVQKYDDIVLDGIRDEFANGLITYLQQIYHIF